MLPHRPSLEQLRKQAKDLLRDARAGDASALARIPATAHTEDAGHICLAQAQLAIAREYGFASWPKLVSHVAAIAGGGFVLRPLIRPVELSPGRRFKLADGTDVPTDDVFAMFVASRDGDIASVKRLAARNPPLVTVEYNYTPPIHFAVREGHREIADFLLDRGAGIPADFRGGPRPRRCGAAAARAAVAALRPRYRNAGHHRGRLGGQCGRGRGRAHPESRARSGEQ